MDIIGDLVSLKESVLNEIEGLYDLETPGNTFVPDELAVRLADITGRINREISVYINRKGRILSISVGDSGTVRLPEIKSRRGKSGFSGIRCIHTHPNGDGRLSQVDISALLNLKLDAMIAIGAKEGIITEIFVALPYFDSLEDTPEAEILGPYKLGDKGMDGLHRLIEEREAQSRSETVQNQQEQEKAILVGVDFGTGIKLEEKSEGERSLDELEELAHTAGVSVVHKVLQRRGRVDSASYIGKGKAEEIGLLRQALNADMVIFDDELSGAQFRNLEEITGAKIIDRTTLILDIFAQRAQSSEGKLQVELAQLNYRLPRLTGLGVQLSRLGGGIGTRGPGEKKLEVDRRHIRRRIKYLETQLENLDKRRDLIRSGRERNEVPVIALVGYTNAGKSTLMNTLCEVDVFAENKLFATLDPTIRRLVLPSGREALLIDTVGFIRKLPHQLIEAFKSTLQETVHADLLLHVVDASSNEIDTQMHVVDEILGSLGALDKPLICVLNKTDLLDKTLRVPMTNAGKDVYEVSAVTGEGLGQLLEGIENILAVDEVEVKVIVPYSKGWVSSYLHENGKILEENFTEEGSEIRALVKRDKMDRIKEFAILLKSSGES